MKSLLPAAAAVMMLALAGGVAVAAPADDVPDAPPAAAPAPAATSTPSDDSQSANVRAGLPDLREINRPAAQVSAKVDFDVQRTPSFHEVSPGGTEITEYRDKGKPVEIDVRSGFGTHYTMTAPLDTSPSMPNNSNVSPRLPSIRLSY
ncbi:hypothetical protein CY652_18240 [Burkholderia sp. WAC0059]|uniref:hypothetical protein n=1 Tax=Burkholderia sp. WAC0059 TaxID=2066022 RepID=UPI000C7F5F2E|nr:hypothetical protein [Burkholderia sp. WAC0059]PLZ00985.1 hypothetical protein CY652_18240 [Burkholderia sp. WAC0059]